MISICIKDNNNNLLDYLMNKIKESNISEIYYSKHTFKIYNNVIVHYKGHNLDDFYNFISDILTKAILNFYEPILFKNIINLNYFYFDNDDKNVIFQEYKILKSKENSIELEKFIFEPINSWIRNNKALVIKGFVNFRLQNYISYLDTLVEQSVSQFVIDKEYIEFVDLLRNYVDSKVPENSIINLVYVNSEAFLLDEDLRIIDLENFNSHYLSDITFSNNDYVLNTLVGLLPHQIVLHLISPEDQFIKTIKLIFNNKVISCSGCELCKAYKMLNLS